MDTVTNDAEGSLIPLETGPGPYRSAEDRVAEILNGEAAPAQKVEETPQPAAPPPTETWDLKTVAERLQVDPAKLYELKVALGDGEEISVSALKDSYKPSAELKKAREAFVEEQAGWQSEREQAQAEFGALIARLDPQALSREFLEEAHRQTEAQRQKISELTLKLIPEWSDAVTRTADWADIGPVAKEYGFTDSDIAVAKKGFTDPRFLKALRDLAKFKAKAKAEAEKPKPKVAQAPKSAKANPVQEHGRLKAAVTKGQIGEVAAVNSILKGAGFK